jgi:formylglycine-generating enzyme required for sulfatase activity
VEPASAELGAGPTGVLNIAGNVAEYVDERRPPSIAFLQFLKTKGVTLPPKAELYTIRGGSFKTPLDFATTYEFVTVMDDSKGQDIGFRCVKPAKIVEDELNK